MSLLPAAVGRRANRLGAVAQNALEVLLLGGLQTGDRPAPFEVVTEQRIYRLRRYFPDSRRADDAPVVLLIPPMMLAAEVYDVSPRASAVTELHRLGMDPWVVDFGAPEHEEGGLERTLTDHVLAVSDAIDRVRRATGRDVHLTGYSQGGMFCYQAAAYRRSAGVGSIVTFGSPVDFSSALPFGIPGGLAPGLAHVLAERVFDDRALPAWASSAVFRALDPVKTLRQRIDFVRRLGDREALLSREGQRRFLEGEGFVAWSGPAIAELLRQFVVHNRMISGGFVIEGRLVTLADLTCPILAFSGDADTIARRASVRAIQRATPRTVAYELPVPSGHFGMIVGSAAGEVTLPAVRDWIRWVEAGDPAAPPPDGLHPIADDGDDDPRAPAVLQSVGLATSAGVGLTRTLSRSARRSARGVLGIASEAASQLPRIVRLEQIGPHTRISLGSLLDEQARRAPDDVLFLFADRAHTHAAAKHRIDSVVRGLVSLGVRQGQHVGVLMGSRPSGLTVVAALSRLGAVAVLMRPGGDLAREAELGGVEVVVADPEQARGAVDALGIEVLVLGGGADPRDLGPGIVDMERIDPDAVRLPAWYRPNPGRAADLAFVVFSGEGDATRAKRVTNHRWALSAFGTAAAASLSRADTVYAVTPLHHPSGLLTSVGGAVASGARIALARAFDASTFWDEVRRYGVTAVSYTWTMLRELTEAPAHPAEAHHPVRLFIGSGMPRGLWLRVLDRFGGGTSATPGHPAGRARVVEFYASTEGDAVLANVTSRPGSKGRRLPGSADVRLARWDPATETLLEGPDGFVLPAEAGEVGMLLARARGGAETLPGTPLRGVFRRGDAWHSTGDLFRVDDQGDWWLVDHAAAAIRTDRGVVYAFPVHDALGLLPAIDLSVVYPLDGADGAPLAVAAVTVRGGHELRAQDLTGALSGLDAGCRPDVVHVVDEIPVTTWFRPMVGPLRAAGVPRPGRPARAWVLDRERGTYVALTDAERRRLVGEEQVAAAD
ncbi:alpha/beta fold hydrolase [Patulibacter sp. SYSU D01012]|uniref:alpha/beta fold hydrolase n=1 Tax=Patulibacter sp. SYSU D01012 TaxID=2817381 RepID=UPI0032BF27DF